MTEDVTTLLSSAQTAPPGIAYYDTLVTALNHRRATLDRALTQLTARAMMLAEVADRIATTLRSGHKVLVAGNGGSAAEAQHFAAELVGRFKRERAPYAVMALTTDSAILTAVANDYGFQDVFARQVRAFGHAGDLLIGFSTSGESPNVIRAAEVAHTCRMSVVAITAEHASTLQRVADVTVRVPVVDTAVAQELHMVVTHLLCGIVENELATWEGAQG